MKASLPRGHLRLGCDVGGTFTDLVVLAASGELRLFKAPTTPEDDAIGGVRNALGLAADEVTGGDVSALLADAECFIYSTTRGLNAVIERTTARTAFLTTRGHPDILVFREGGKVEPFNLHLEYPKPYIPRRLTFQIPERIGSHGEVVDALDEAATADVLRRVGACRIEAIAVCLLWSIANPDHELAVGRLIEEILPGVPYTLSHQLNPIVREYRRASSTAINASLRPTMSRHFESLRDLLADLGLRGGFLCVTSAGTVVEIDRVIDRPVDTLNSGPSVAPVAGRYFSSLHTSRTAPECVAELFDDRSLIVVDTGGTSFDVSLVQDGVIGLKADYWLGERFLGHILGMPAVDVKSVGAGGGSIAWLDAGGLLRVGPQSAGAHPGPACYGRGGSRATVTDSALVLGYLDPHYFMGGRMKLNESRARVAIDAIAEPLSLGAEEAAGAIFAVANQHMVDAIEEITLGQGIDPREATIVAGGGASGLSIDAIARELGCVAVLIPRTAAGLSASGCVLSDLACDFRRTFFTTSASFDHTGVNRVLEVLDGEARAFIESTGVEPGEENLSWYVSARYAYQVWDIEVPLQVTRFAGGDVGDLVSDFHDLHARMFAVSDPQQYIECISWRVRGSGRLEKARLRASESHARHGVARRRVFSREHGWLDAAVYGGAELAADEIICGPALVEETTTTVVVLPGSRMQVLRGGDFLLMPAVDAGAACTHWNRDLMNRGSND